MEFNFDEIIDRKNTHAYKYDALQRVFGRSDILPLWVADMEFRSPQCITDALKGVLEQGVYGYSSEPAELFDSIHDWILTEHGWDVSKEWYTYVGGIVRGIAYAVQFFTKPGDKIIVQSPVYHPFTLVPEGNGRTVLRNPLKGRDMDFENLEQLLAEDGVKMMILCNPHNPGGYAWSRETLQRVAALCAERNVIVISDEIHCDLYLWGGKHIPFATVSDEAASCSITFGAPSKTFNIPGLASSYCLIPDAEIREPFYRWLGANEFNDPGIMSSLGAIAAFRHGRQWRDAVVSYIEQNILYIENRCASFTDKDGRQLIVPVRPDASYLVWLDCRWLLAELSGKNVTDLQPKDQKLLEDYFVNRLRLGLNSGVMFGREGLGFMRLNVACPRKLLGFEFVL